MATPLTGSLGWTANFPLQLGGPPLISAWSRPIGKQATPLLAHIYENDGVTSKGLLAINGRPAVQSTAANGGLGQLTLEVASQSTAAIYGQFVYGVQTYGGKVLQGNVIRLTEHGSPFQGFVYSGIIESLPDVRSSTGTVHQIVLAPFGIELTRVACQALYTTPVDVAQVFRDAVALTQHCHCDTVSVPATTGVPIVGTPGTSVDFRGWMVSQVLDQVRALLGPTWYWHCDELGRTWLQPQGSAAVYTLQGGQQYAKRTTNGGDIANRKNQLQIVGGVPPGSSAPVSAIYNGPSQAQIGVRTLVPPIQISSVTDQAHVNLLAQGIGGILDQTWTRVAVDVLPPTGDAHEVHPQRIHQSQPGGAMVRYREQPVNPMPESGSGSGYVGPFILQTHSYDGTVQQVELGNVPVTSQQDIDATVKALAQREASWRLLHFPIMLADVQQVMTGSVQSGATTVAGGFSSGAPASLWRLDPNQLALYDANGVARVRQGNLPANGVSPAGFKFEVDDGNGNPLFDSSGLISILNSLGSSFLSGLFSTASATPVLVTGSAVTFSLTRALRVDVRYAASCSYGGAGTGTAVVDLFVDSVNQSAGGNGPAIELQFAPTTSGAETAGTTFSPMLAAGSHTIDLRASQNGTPSLTLTQAALIVYLHGS